MRSIPIKGFIPVTLLDWPGEIASMIFVGGCNFRCPFCYNVDLVLRPKQLPDIEEKKIFEHLLKKKKWLDGVCLSILGTEPVLVRQNGIIKNIPIKQLWIDGKRTNFSLANVEIQECQNLKAFTINQEFSEVKEIIRHKINRVYEIITEGNFRLLVSGGHSIFVLSEKGLYPKEVKKLKAGEYLITPKQLPSPNNLIKEIYLPDYFQKELILSRKKMLQRKKYWMGIISKIRQEKMPFSKAARLYGHSRHTIRRYAEAYEKGEKLLEELCYTSRPNLLWINRNFLCSGYTKLLPTKLPITSGFAELLGYATAEGSGRDYYIFTLGNEPELALRIIGLFRKIFKSPRGTILIRKDTKKRFSLYSVEVGGKYLSSLISKLTGVSAETKKVPDFLFNTNTENQRTFVLALNRGDGHIRERKKYSLEEFSIKTISRQLAADLVLLLKIFGIQSLISVERGKENRQDSYKIHFHGNQYSKLNLSQKVLVKYSFTTHLQGIPKELMGMAHLKKYYDQSRIDLSDIPLKYQNPNPVFQIAQKWNILKIKEIKQKAIKNQYVYDLVVNGDNSFIGGLGGFLLHNSGGEPTLYPEGLINFCQKVKDLGFKIQIQTNGTNPELLDKLIKQNLVDYIAMDIKGPLEKYDKIVGTKVDKEKIQKSVNLISRCAQNKQIEAEFRTTIVPGLLDKKDIEAIGKWLINSNLPPKARLAKGGKSQISNLTYYLQQFRNEKTLDPKLEKVKPYPKEELEKMKEIAEKYFKKVELRGV
jgi:pyruvate formate lyase activating enzyme